MYSSPVALLFGVLGIIFDRHRLLPIIVTLVAGGFVLLFLGTFLAMIQYTFLS